ncbi:MAG: acyl-CoA dehydrogenase family protein, partial [Streptosporangiales bacterium]|nr:acyl-CoA dehydrogenase family protein [Streptosporangiales bacterium]
DLAGIRSRAVRDGERWILNGAKIWTSGAYYADYGMCLARTDWDVPKHQGLTYFVLPMRQPGVEVRPLKEMNYHDSFNEVFLTDARIPKDWVIGEVGQGWAAALTTLAHERRFGVSGAGSLEGAEPGRVLDETWQELADVFRTYSWYPQRAGRADLAVAHAQAAGVAGDPVIRQEIARLLAMQRASEWTSRRAKVNRATGKSPGPEGSIGKLALSGVARQAARVHAMIAGPAGMLAGDDPASPLDGVIAEVLISVPAQSIAGGTDEIQKNILGEKFLGLPREPDPARGRPYREVRNR